MSATQSSVQPPVFTSSSPHPPSLSTQYPIYIMRITLLFAMAVLLTMCTAALIGFVPPGDLLAKPVFTSDDRQTSGIEGIESRDIVGGLIAAIPGESSIPVERDDTPSTKRRFLRRSEVIVPESLQEASSKRALRCKTKGYGLCPSLRMCCPIGAWRGEVHFSPHDLNPFPDRWRKGL